MILDTITLRYTSGRDQTQYDVAGIQGRYRDLGSKSEYINGIHNIITKRSYDIYHNDPRRYDQLIDDQGLVWKVVDMEIKEIRSPMSKLVLTVSRNYNYA